MQGSAAKVVIGSAFGDGADLRLLLKLRAAAITGQTLALVVSSTILEVELPVFTLAFGIAVLAALNLYTWMRLTRTPALHLKPVALLNDRAFFYQILADIAVLTYLLYFAGGPFNPFHDMYLLPLTIAAAALPWTYVWRVVAFSITGYSLVATWYVPLALDTSRAHGLMILGEWVCHILLALLISYFVVRIAAGVRRRDRLLEEAHAKELRNGCAVAVGSVAAGVTHELGTPLSTISVLLGEMRNDHANDPELKPSLDLMAGRLDECKHILSRLRAFVNSLSQGDMAIPVDCLLDDVAKRFRHIRPGVTLTRQLEGERPGPRIVPDIALQQAIINLLNNASDVSPNEVALEANWTADSLTVRVRDHGPGISPELADKLGDILVTTKPPEEGTGLGLFLTNVTMNRLGGRLRLFNEEAGGACAELFLPIRSPLLDGDTR